MNGCPLFFSSHVFDDSLVPFRNQFCRIFNPRVAQLMDTIDDLLTHVLDDPLIVLQINHRSAQPNGRLLDEAMPALDNPLLVLLGNHRSAQPKGWQPDQ